MDVVPGTEHTHPSPIPARCTKLYSQQRIQVNEGQVRLETETSGLPPNRQALWTTGSGPVCITANPPMPTLLQLAARSICRGRRCLPAGLVDGEGVCQPSLEPHTLCIKSGSDSRGGPSVGDPSVEGSTLVCIAHINASGLATPPPTSGVVNTSGKNVSKPTFGRMEHIRESLKSQGLSDQATSLIARSWRTKTSQSYDSLFKRWDRWCSERSSNPFSGPVSEVANFLASLFEEGYQYSSVNAYRSAISSVHDKVDGASVGQHPTIVRLLKVSSTYAPQFPITWLHGMCKKS